MRGKDLMMMRHGGEDHLRVIGGEKVKAVGPKVESESILYGSR